MDLVTRIYLTPRLEGCIPYLGSYASSLYSVIVKEKENEFWCIAISLSTFYLFKLFRYFESCIPSLPSGPASWVWGLCSYTRFHTHKGLAIDSMLCFCHLEMLNFLTAPTFSFCSEPRKLCSQFCLPFRKLTFSFYSLQYLLKIHFVVQHHKNHVMGAKVKFNIRGLMIQ